jgi:hypothetical protein
MEWQMSMNPNKQTIKIWGKLPYRISVDKPWVYARCDVLQLHGSGDSEVSAAYELRNAIQGFLQVAFEDGTIHPLLKAAGFGFHQVDRVAQWAAEDPRRPDIEYRNLEFEFTFETDRLPESPAEVEPFPDTIRSLVMAIRGTDQSSRAA